MRAFVLIAIICLSAVAVQAQVNGGWSPWTECSQLCDSGVTFRSCNNPTPSGGGAYCTGINFDYCNTQPCVNCTVSDLTWYSPCTVPCGGGTTWRARYIIQQPGPGGTPCPQLNFTYPCNTDFCMEELGGYGFYFWGPFMGPGPLKYNIWAWDANVDVFVFDQPNFLQYQFDVQRPTPFNTGYSPLRAMLNVDNAADTVPLDTTSQYYLVVDHTWVGAASGTTNNNGQQVFLPNRFTYLISGVDYGTGQNTAPYVSAASRVSLSIPLFVGLIAGVVALLR